MALIKFCFEQCGYFYDLINNYQRVQFVLLLLALVDVSNNSIMVQKVNFCDRRDSNSAGTE